MPDGIIERYYKILSRNIYREVKTKKGLSLALLTVLLLSSVLALTACDDGEATPTAPAPTAEPTPEEKKITVELTDEGFVPLTITDMSRHSGEDSG